MLFVRFLWYRWFQLSVLSSTFTWCFSCLCWRGCDSLSGCLLVNIPVDFLDCHPLEAIRADLNEPDPVAPSWIQSTWNYLNLIDSIWIPRWLCSHCLRRIPDLRLLRTEKFLVRVAPFSVRRGSLPAGQRPRPLSQLISSPPLLPNCCNFWSIPSNNFKVLYIFFYLS